MLAKALFNHNRYLALVILAILAVGYSSFSSMGRQEDPTITPFVASVTTLFPGANPARVESLVTKPIEDALREVPEVTEVKSTSTSGVSVITVEVDERMSTADIDRSWSELRDVVARVSSGFPAGVQAPVFDDDLMTAWVKIVSIAGADGRELPAGLLRREAENFADAARGVPFTRRVKPFGLPEEEVRVALNEAKLASTGITIDEVTRALANADARTPAGKLTGSGTAITVELAGEFSSVASVSDVIVRSNPNGRVVRISDIATIVKDERRPLPRIAFSNGQRSVLVAVEMVEGFQVDRYSTIFDDFLATYVAEAPAGLDIKTSFSQSTYTEERLASVAKNLVLGVALVLIVLLVTLGWRAALVVAVVLPLCTLLSMIGLLYMEVRIHEMSLTGLVVALGLLVDGSIVMADEVRKRLLDGLTPIDALSGAVSRLRVPLIASTVTTVLAFLPMAILQGTAGDFLGSIAKAVIMMLLASLVLALTITPVLAAKLLPSGLVEDARWWQRGISNSRVGRFFSETLDWSLKHPVGAIVLALSLPVTGFMSTSTLTKQFFPGTNRDQIYLDVRLPEGSAMEDTLTLVRQLDEQLRAEPLIRRVDWTAGEFAPAFYYNMKNRTQNDPAYAQGLVLTTDKMATDALVRRLQISLDRRYPEARIVVHGIDPGPPVAAPLEVVLYGPNIDTLKTLGEVFRQRIAQLPDITHTMTSMPPGAPKLLFELDDEKIRRAGLQRVTVANAIDAALRGRIGGEVLEDTERLPVRAQLVSDNWANANDLGNLRIPLGAGALNRDGVIAAVPLSALGNAVLVPDDSPITRLDGERINRVQAFLTRGVLPEEALALLRQNLASDPIVMPDGYRFKFGGDSDERAGVVNDLIAPMGIIVSALIATILLTFNSWRLTAVALLVCVCSFGLSLLSLALFKYSLGVLALIGVIGSIGVSINAAIIILTALQQDPGAAAGRLSAIRDVVMDSSRHIVSTTVTTFGGFLPLILEGGQFWPPFAMSIAGGVLLSTVISFYLVPPMFLLCLPRERSRHNAAIDSLGAPS